MKVLLLCNCSCNNLDLGTLVTRFDKGWGEGEKGGYGSRSRRLLERWEPTMGQLLIVHMLKISFTLMKLKEGVL
jgi:hypothetical protein